MIPDEKDVKACLEFFEQTMKQNPTAAKEFMTQDADEFQACMHWAPQGDTGYWLKRAAVGILCHTDWWKPVVNLARLAVENSDPELEQAIRDGNIEIINERLKKYDR